MICYHGTSEQILKQWMDGVRATCEATSYEQHMLWQEYSLEYLELEPALKARPGLRVLWEQGSPGFVHTIRGVFGSTSIVLNVNRIDGHLVLFWYGSSTVVHYNEAYTWINEAFPHARASFDPMNFGNTIHRLREQR